MGDAEKVAAVLKDFRTAPISDAEKALFNFLEKVNYRSNTLGAADIAEVKAAGWSDEALYDAITVCAIFNFYNRWVDATGGQDMPALGYQMSGHRLATEGYVRPRKEWEATKGEVEGFSAGDRQQPRPGREC